MVRPDLAALDQIALSGAVFYGYHGVNAAEKELGQRFVVDLTVWADLRRAGESDDLTNTINYSTLYKTVRGVVEGDSCDLLEAVATRIARAVLAAFPVAAARVTFTKPNPPLKGSAVGAASVTITRYQEDVASTATP